MGDNSQFSNKWWNTLAHYFPTSFRKRRVTEEKRKTISVTNRDFERFVEACEDSGRLPSGSIQEAAERLDREGL